MKKLLIPIVLLSLGLIGCKEKLPPHTDTLGKAFFLAQNEDLRGEAVAGQPVYNLADYEFIVANANIDVAKVRELAPGAQVYAYMPLRFAPLYGADESLYGQYRALFNEKDYLHDQETGERLSTYPNTQELVYNGITARALAAFMGSNGFDMFDGIYLDNFTANLRPGLLDVIMKDDMYTSPEEVEVMYDMYRDSVANYFEQFNPDRPLVCNVGTGMAGLPKDLPLDGITQEHESEASVFNTVATKFPVGMCVSWEWESPTARFGVNRYAPSRQLAPDVSMVVPPIEPSEVSVDSL